MNKGQLIGGYIITWDKDTDGSVKVYVTEVYPTMVRAQCWELAVRQEGDSGRAAQTLARRIAQDLGEYFKKAVKP